jgi:tetratricopeptide (TPR) repeat protein
MRQSLAVANDSRDIDLLNCLGVAYKNIGLREEAKTFLERAIAKARENRSSRLGQVSPLCNLAYLMQAEGNNQGALASLRLALRILKENEQQNTTSYTNISESVMQLHFSMKNYHEGLLEINLIFRNFIDNRRTIEAEYYRFREQALKSIITTMSHSKKQEDMVLMEGLLSEYYPEQERVADTLRRSLFPERGTINEMEALD